VVKGQGECVRYQGGERDRECEAREVEVTAGLRGKDGYVR
jgi:hypothetical protein